MPPLTRKELGFILRGLHQSIEDLEVAIRIVENAMSTPKEGTTDDEPKPEFQTTVDNPRTPRSYGLGEREHQRRSDSGKYTEPRELPF